MAFSDEILSDVIYGRHYPIDEKPQAENYFDGYSNGQIHNKRRKVIRVRVPSYLSRNKLERQHKYTVVRKRPLVPYTKSQTINDDEPLSITPRRIVVTRVRSLGARSRQFFDDKEEEIQSYTPSLLKRHKVTVTRTRKLGPTLNIELNKTPRTRVTRKKLVTVRPVVTSTPSFAIITTGFYGIVDNNNYDKNDEIDEEYNTEDEAESEDEESSGKLPTLVGSVDNFEEKPNIITEINEHDENSPELEASISEELTTTMNATPVIITDNFFFPASSEEYEDELVDEENVSTTEQNSDELKSVEYDITHRNTVNISGSNKKELIPIIEENTTAINIESTTGVFSTSDLKSFSETIESSSIPKNTELLAQSDSIESFSSSLTDEESTLETTIQLDVSPPSLDDDDGATEKITTASTMPEIILEQSTPMSPGYKTIPSILENPTEDLMEELSVVPLESFIETSSRESVMDTSSVIPSVIPLESSMSKNENNSPSFLLTETLKIDPSPMTTMLITSPSSEDIEADLSDELYLSLSRPDLPQISPSRIAKESNNNVNQSNINSISLQNEPSPIVVFTETIVTSTRLKTYTYVVTKVNGIDTEVTSSTTVRPRVTTLTLTIPVTILPSSTNNMETMSTNTVSSASHRISDAPESRRETKMLDMNGEDEGRRLNLATRVMSNGVEVIVAGPTPALRWENSNLHPTLTLSDAVVMLMPQGDLNEFVTKTCTTTFTYLNTITKDGTTIVSTDQQVIANTATEERHRKPGLESAAVTLHASPTLRTEVFKTTYTYLTLNTDHSDVDNALSSSQKVITNTVTAPQHFLDMFLEPSEVPPPQTNTYLSTRILEKTFIEDGMTRIGTMSDTITQLIITESALPPPRPISVTTTLTALDDTENIGTDIMKTYYITYTYYNTYVEKGSNTVVHTNVATSTDIAVEKAAKKTGIMDTQITVTQTSPEPIKIFATKTYLTTFTYFTTLLQAGTDGETSTTISSRSHIVENVVTESIAPSLLNAGYMNILTTAHHSDSVKNVVTGSTIIFFDEEDQIDSSSTSTEIQPTTTLDSVQTTIENLEIIPVKQSDLAAELQNDQPVNQSTGQNSNESDLSAAATSNQEDSLVVENDTSENNDVTVGHPVSGGGLLSLGSLGMNGLSALGPVITAMAGLLQGKPSKNRRNDTDLSSLPSSSSSSSSSSSTPVTHQEPQEVTSQRSPIYIPVAEFADGDIEAAESQNIAAQLAILNPNFIPETRHKIAASIVDGIPISPGEIITTNSDVIIGKPGILSPRPPQTYSHNENNQNIGMKPPPISVPNIPVHPVLEVIRDDRIPESTRPIQDIGAAISPKRPPIIPLSLSKEPFRSASQDVLKNDPLLKPPSRPNIEKYANPNINLKESEWILDRFRRPWSSKESLMPPPLPSTNIDEHSNHYSHGNKQWPSRNENENRPLWAQQNPLITGVNLESSEPTKTEPIQSSEPIIHQIPHVIDRSTGEPLLVNIQPSQVANVVIPDSGTQVLIFGDTSEPHKSGQYFDEPSPYPESQVASNSEGFHLEQNNLAQYMRPPAPPAINFKPLPQKLRPQSAPNANLHPYSRFPRPHDKIEIAADLHSEKSPSDISLIERPDGQVSQGQVHTEILVHHSADTSDIHMNSQPQSNQYQPPRRQYHKPSATYDQPPRRTTDVSNPIEIPSHHQHYHYGYYHEKPNRTLTNEVLKQQKWTSNRTKQRIPVIRPRPLVRPRPNPYPDRTSGYSSGNPRYPPLRPSQVPQAPHPPQIPINWQDKINKEDSIGLTYQKEDQVAPGSIPTGAIGYKNPLITNMKRPMTLLPVQSTVYQPHTSQNHQVHQLPPDVSPPEIQSFGQILPRPDEPDLPWSETQTEAGPDSSADETEPSVKYHADISDNYQQTEHQEQQENQSIIKYNQEDPVQQAENEEHEVYADALQTEKPYDNTAVINTIVEKPIEQHQNVSHNNKSQMTFDDHQNSSMIEENSSEYYDENSDIKTKDDEKIPNGKLDYETIQTVSYDDKISEYVSTSEENDDTIDLKPPAILPQFIREKPTRQKIDTLSHEIKTTVSSRIQEEIENHAMTTVHPPGGHARPSVDWDNFEKNVNFDNNKRYPTRRNLTSNQSNFPQNSHKKLDSKYIDTGKIRNQSVSIQTGDSRVHLAYPHILTKPRPAIPLPVTISSGSSTNQKRPQNKEKGSTNKFQTASDRPITMRPSLIIHAKDKNRETLETAYQTNFASNEEKDDRVNEKRPVSTKHNDLNPPNVPSQNMMPPPRTEMTNKDKLKNNKDDGEGDLKPPPMPSDVFGMSPPPVIITSTTSRPIKDKANQSDLKPPPPKYIPISESTKVIGETPPPPLPSLPSANMVPPSVPRPTKPRPFLMELLSQDMVPPPPPVIESSRQIEISTVRPAIAVSGSIQIATAVEISHIPIMQDITESTIPIIHGTVDLPVVMDVSDIMESAETRKPEHVSIYTVRPFETRKISRVSVQPTAILSTNLIMPTRLRLPQIDLTSSSTRSSVQSTRIYSHYTPKKPSVILEASKQSISSSRINPTQSLNHYKPQSSSQNINPDDITFTSTTKRKYGSFHIKSSDSTSKMTKKFGIVPTSIHETTKNVTTTTTTITSMEMKAVTHFKTLTVTRTETSVVGSPPTTRTLLLTHTLTSRVIETVTETLLRPTNVVITSVTTILQPATRLPNYDSSPDNMDSIFVVMSDQNPPAADAEEVEAEYGGEEEISRDEQDPTGNEIHRVLSGSVLGAPIIPYRPPLAQCQPECRASKSEMCIQVENESRCICRPGFARMFPDRPCKPTYTYTLRIGLDRIGHESAKYENLINDTTSPSFRKLAGPTREALDRTLMQSDLRDVYRGLEIVGFHPNPTQVEFHVRLSDNSNEMKLKEIIKKYLLSSNYSLGGTEVFASKDFNTIDARDFDECSTEQGGPHHDCSPHAACFNLRGSYQCSCKEGWADLSESSAYPGRICSQAPLGCPGCNNKGHCLTNGHGQEVCECFPWHSGQRCQVNLKVLLIALVTAGAILLGLFGVCLALACFRQPSKARKSSDRRAMIASGAGGDTSSEGSVTELAIPHHIPHVLPPPPRSVVPAPPNSKRSKKPAKKFRAPKNSAYAGAPLATNELANTDRSLSVMIPRAKYRSGPQSPQNYSKAQTSTFTADEHKLINYLEGGGPTGNRKASVVSTTKEYIKSYEESGLRVARNVTAPNSGALVSAGFQVSATVMRTGDGESTLDDTLEPSTLKTLRSTTDYQDGASTLAMSCEATTIQATTKLLPLDLTEGESSVGHSFTRDTSNGKQATPSRGSKDTQDARDSASEGPITAERDLGSTLRLRHTPLYNPDRAASDRDSNFDSL